MTGWRVAAAILAVYRMTRLVTTDRVFRTPREWAIRWSYRRTYRRHQIPRTRMKPGDWTALAGDDDESPALAYAITCWWCSSIYCAAAAACAWWLIPDVWWPLSALLALSAVTGLIHTIEVRVEGE